MLDEPFTKMTNNIAFDKIQYKITQVDLYFNKNLIINLITKIFHKLSVWLYTLSINNKAIK